MHYYMLSEARMLIEQWRVHYNTVRPHSSLGYRPQAPQTIVPIWPQASMLAQCNGYEL